MTHPHTLTEAPWTVRLGINTPDIAAYLVVHVRAASYADASRKARAFARENVGGSQWVVESAEEDR